MRRLFSMPGAMVILQGAMGLPALGAAGLPSSSKISVHQLVGYSSGTASILQAHPRVLKVVMGTGWEPILAMRDYKASTPQGKVVVRVYNPIHFNNTDDPVASANTYWNNVLAPQINNLSPADRALIDYLEGPNECDNTPCWSSLQDAAWFNTFWVTLAPLIGNAGLKPCAFSIPVGNPPGDSTYVHQVLDTIVPALRACQSSNGAWSYHSYTILYTTDVNTELWYSLRYRQYYSYFATNYPDLVNLPIILTEGGVDGQSSGSGPGWLGGGAQKYEDWLTWFDGQLQQDSVCLGITLFEIGDPSGWPSFDLEPIAGWLTNYLLAHPGTPPPPAPAGLTATPGDHQVVLSWTASPGASGYNVKSSTTSGGPYASVATDVTATGYICTRLTNGMPGYFVVSAIGPGGEGPDSTEATATPKPPFAPCDFDRDGDVDQDDFGRFQACISGTGVTQGDPDCAWADLNGDGDVDQQDLARFRGCMGGAGVIVDTNCAILTPG